MEYSLTIELKEIIDALSIGKLENVPPKISGPFSLEPVNEKGSLQI